MRRIEKVFILMLCVCFVLEIGGIVELTPFLHQPVSSIVQNVRNLATSAATESTELLEIYSNKIMVYPLAITMITAAVLAVAGDAIAQSREPEDYDIRRAFSFMVFDVSYRVLQHTIFPIIVDRFQGDMFLGMVSLIPRLTDTVRPQLLTYFAAMEQTLANQLVIVPFLYYPVFFSVTGAIQGLSVEGAIKRAKENFLPLLKRNLLFWVPVQFVQFGFVQGHLQVPFLCTCGLAWTFILSVMAGSTKDYNYDAKPCCTTGKECHTPTIATRKDNKTKLHHADTVVIDITENNLIPK